MRENLRNYSVCSLGPVEVKTKKEKKEKEIVAQLIVKQVFELDVDVPCSCLHFVNLKSVNLVTFMLSREPNRRFRVQC